MPRPPRVAWDCLQSIGVGTIVPHGDTQSSSFIKAVNRQLCAAKKNGRNQIKALRTQA